MLIMDLIKTLKENEPVVFDYDNNYMLFKIIHKHYQVARCIVAVNDKTDYMKEMAFYRIIRDEIQSIEISTDSDMHIPYLLVKIKN